MAKIQASTLKTSGKKGGGKKNEKAKKSVAISKRIRDIKRLMNKVGEHAEGCPSFISYATVHGLK